MKRLVFLTGTRADFGKLKSLIDICTKSNLFEVHVFVTGMHLERKYGYTFKEIKKHNYQNLFSFKNTTSEKTMDLTLAKTIKGFSNFLKKVKPDLVIIHGDRVEALAGAISGSLNNILVAHIEGGEVSGTIDELIRHAVSKMSHVHFVSNNKAKNRLIQMGEIKENIFVIGSPDVDIMMSNNLPNIDFVKKWYEINFVNYGIVLFHPVTTESKHITQYANNLVEALLKSNKNYIVIYPNNDLGSDDILKVYKDKLSKNSKFKIFPSIRFEYFLVLLKNADFIVGNSSAGIREAPYYGLTTINIGTRQKNRAISYEGIINADYTSKSIYCAIKNTIFKNNKIEHVFGFGNSDTLFLEAINKDNFWQLDKQKHFKDI